MDDMTYIKDLCIKTQYNVLYTTISYTEKYIKQDERLYKLIDRLNKEGYLLDHFNDDKSYLNIKYITNTEDIKLLDTFFILSCNMNSLYNNINKDNIKVNKYNKDSKDNIKVKMIDGGYTRNILKNLREYDFYTDISCDSDHSIDTQFLVDSSTGRIDEWYIGGHHLNDDTHTLNRIAYITNGLITMDISSNFNDMDNLIFYNNGRLETTHPGYTSKNLYISGFLRDHNGNINPKLIWHISCHGIEWRNDRRHSRDNHECCPEYYHGEQNELYFLDDSKIHFQIDIIGDDNSLVHNICFKCFRWNSHKMELTDNMLGLSINLNNTGINPIDAIMEQIHNYTNDIQNRFHRLGRNFSLNCVGQKLDITPDSNNNFFNLSLNVERFYNHPFNRINSLNLSLGNISNIGLFLSNQLYSAPIRNNSIEQIVSILTKNPPDIIMSENALKHTINYTHPNPNIQRCSTLPITGGLNSYQNQSLYQKYLYYYNKYYR